MSAGLGTKDRPYFTVRAENVRVDVVWVGDTVRVLWSDGVANEWFEDYSNFAVALMRVAVILHGARAGGGNFSFTETQLEFAQRAVKLLAESVDVGAEEIYSDHSARCVACLNGDTHDDEEVS